MMGAQWEEMLKRVGEERYRQEELRRAGKFPHTCAGLGYAQSEKLVVLAEEFGEVSRHVAEFIASGELDEMSLRKELIQVAAVAVAWAESLS